MVKLAEGEIDPKLKVKYSFLFKERDQMLPSERRWKWVKKECYPDELAELIERLSNKKTNKTKDEKKRNNKVALESDEDEGDEYVTQVKTRNDLTLDYTNPQIVKDNLEVLTNEKFKGKYSPSFHVQVLTRMVDMMP